ncbi:hypothetical protein ACFE04_000666 [Oxalis oulophora]
MNGIPTFIVNSSCFLFNAHSESSNNRHSHGPRGNKIYVSGPLLGPTNNMDQMLKEHDRKIQEYARSARLDKTKPQGQGKQLVNTSTLVSMRVASDLEVGSIHLPCTCCFKHEMDVFQTWSTLASMRKDYLATKSVAWRKSGVVPNMALAREFLLAWQLAWESIKC